NAAYRQSDWAVTADGGAHVALAAAAAGGRPVGRAGGGGVFRARPRPPPGAARAAAETAVKAIAPAAVIARTSLIIGDGGSKHERFVHALAAGTAAAVLDTAEVRGPVHAAALAAALLELAAAPHAGTCHVAGADAVSRHELGL